MLRSCALCLRIQTHYWLAIGMVCLSAGNVHAVDAPVVGANFDEKTNIAFPPSPAIVDVTKAPYHAKPARRGATIEPSPHHRPLH